MFAVMFRLNSALIMSNNPIGYNGHQKLKFEIFSVGGKNPRKMTSNDRGGGNVHRR